MLEFKSFSAYFQKIMIFQPIFTFLCVPPYSKTHKWTSTKPLFLKIALKTSKIAGKWWFWVFTMEILWSTSYFGFIDFWPCLAKWSRKITWGGKNSHLWVSKKSIFFKKCMGEVLSGQKNFRKKNWWYVKLSKKNFMCRREKLGELS